MPTHEKLKLSNKRKWIGNNPAVKTHVKVAEDIWGQGDWIPEHAGNLDIINCAALNIAEKYAMQLRAQSTQSFSDKIKSLLGRKKPAYEVHAEAV